VLDRLAHAEDVQNGDDAASRVAERVMREVRKEFEAVLEAREVEHRRQMVNKEKRHAEEKQHLRDQLHDALAEAKRADEEATTLANSDLATTEQVVRALRAEMADLLAGADATQAMLTQACRERDKANAENERLRECNDAMREPMRKLREALDMPAQGEGYVIDFAIRDLARLNTHVADLHRRFNTLGEERDEALRLLATRVEAKRLDEAQEESKRLREACTLALNVMEQKNRVNVPPFAKFITVEFAPEDVAALRAALEKKP